MQTLWDLPRNQKAQILSLSDLLSKDLTLRLEHMGVISGEPIQCLRWLPFGGPRIFQISDSIFSLDEDVAKLIEIKG